MNSNSLTVYGATITFLALFFSSCAMTKAPSEQEEILARSFKAPKGKALLYVYRPSTLMRHEAKHVVINQRSIGVTGSGTFLATALSPGTYIISTGGDPIHLTPSPGRLYFIRQNPEYIYTGNTMAIMAPAPMVLPSPSLVFSSELVSEAEGREGVSKCKQVATGNF